MQTPRRKTNSWYLLIEVLSGLAFAGLYIRFGLGMELVKYLVLVCTLIVVVITDIDQMIIPDKVVVFAVISGVVLNIATNADLRSVALGAFIPAIFMYLLAMISKGGVGGGDIKLTFAAGLYLGWPTNAIAVLIAFILGGLTGIALFLTGQKNKDDTMVFGPYLAVGIITTAIWGQQAVNYCLKLLHY